MRSAGPSVQDDFEGVPPFPWADAPQVEVQPLPVIRGEALGEVSQAGLVFQRLAVEEESNPVLRDDVADVHLEAHLLDAVGLPLQVIGAVEAERDASCQCRMTR